MGAFKWSQNVKWFTGIDAARGSIALAPGPLPPFNLEVLGSDNWRRRLAVRLQHRFFLCYFAIARRIFPFPPLPIFWKVVCVTRAVDVTEVLENTEIFQVPYGPEMKELAGGVNFMLGMDGRDHIRQRAIIEKILRQEDAATLIGYSHRFARALIDASGGTIDVMSDFVTRVATETCARYFGIYVAEPDAFAEWALSLSALLFADPSGEPDVRKLALNGAARLRSIVDQAIRKSKANNARGNGTLVDRLVTLQVSSEGPADDEICAMLVGMIVGFIPTTTLAAGRMLEELLRRPEKMNDAMRAARGGNTAKLEAILWEAARLNPALQPGQWRYACCDGFIGKGRRAKKITKGTVLMVSTLSALRDGAAFKCPNQFRIDRPQRPDFIFGKGSHDCLGWRLAMAQITAVFTMLMGQANLRPCAGANGGMAWIGPLPRRLDMTFEDAKAPATQSMITVLAPVRGISKDQLNDQLRSLGNPSDAASRISKALTATGLVHFASMAVIDVGDPAKPSLYLLLELNVDGPVHTALEAVTAQAADCLLPIFGEAIPQSERLYTFLQRHVLRMHRLPWGAVGLHFNGTPEFPVAGIEQQAALATFCRGALNQYLKGHLGLTGRAWGAINRVRELINQDPKLQREAAKLRADGCESEASELEELLHRGADFADLLIFPKRRRPQFPVWIDPGPWTTTQQLHDFFSSDAGRTTASCLFAVGFGFTIMNFLYLNASAMGPYLERLGSGVLALFDERWRPLPSLGDIMLQSAALAPNFVASVVISLVCAVVMEGLIVAGAVGAFVWFLRRKEVSDEVDDEAPTLANIKESFEVENPPGFAQNHFMAVSRLKRGLFRRMTLALALGGIALMVMTRFRKGFVLNMGTIHYAQWFRPPSSDSLIFLANYDGSWESYLEDFIMRAHAGQTAVWSNCIGFPRTSFLVKGGAFDGDRFKRWVRRQQQIAPFWFSRFPSLTTSQIRNNALIHYGLARAMNDVAARAWLGCFGSMQRPDDAIETAEVQSLVFTGFGDLPYAACAVVKVPQEVEGRRKWLRGITRDAADTHVQALCFGDVPVPQDRQSAAAVAFSARGLAKFGLPPASGTDGLATFSAAFNLGMSKRRRVLGDPAFAPQNGGWSDGEADAVLLVYGCSADQRDRRIREHIKLLRDCGGSEIGIVYTAPVGGDASGEFRREHFGFRDGISQPVIRGTQRFALQPLTRDIVEAGEFIFGYANNQGYFPPSCTVRSESDPGRNLSIPMPDSEAVAGEGATSKFPNFGALDLPYSQRDFGRNGSFLVVRQLVQDVDGFKAFTETKAREVMEQYSHLSGIVAGHVNADWIAAKMMGRWRDGTPLIDRPGVERGSTDANVGKSEASPKVDDVSVINGQIRFNNPDDNDFAYGTDDPSGLLCPLGAHIRRANPRDSLQPGDPDEQRVTNRHRLLRRGRSYEIGSKKNPEKGLLFIALCSDLERQFEFVQQTWLNSPSFHGLTCEPDPITSRGEATDSVFTIPTASGPIVLRSMQSFVSVKAGGYFFLPSRSSLEYLIDLSPVT